MSENLEFYRIFLHSYYAKLKRLEEERQKELAEKYRDRARERRDGGTDDYDNTEMISTTADYRAVAPDAKSIENYAERRKQVIQESKYLGGDMEHTHLVKGKYIWYTHTGSKVNRYGTHLLGQRYIDMVHTYCVKGKYI